MPITLALIKWVLSYFHYQLNINQKTFDYLMRLSNVIIFFYRYTKKVCKICSKTYADSKCLKKHIQAVHRKMKPYVCNICGHQSAKKAMMQIHIRSHTGEKPYACTVEGCSYRTGHYVFIHCWQSLLTECLQVWKTVHCQGISPGPGNQKRVREFSEKNWKFGKFWNLNKYQRSPPNPIEPQFGSELSVRCSLSNSEKWIAE